MRDRYREKAEKIVKTFEEADANRARLVNDIYLELVSAFRDGAAHEARCIRMQLRDQTEEERLFGRDVTHCFEEAVILKLEYVPSESNTFSPIELGSGVVTVRALPSCGRDANREVELHFDFHVNNGDDLQWIQEIHSYMGIDKKLGHQPIVYVMFKVRENGKAYVERIERNPRKTDATPKGGETSHNCGGE